MEKYKIDSIDLLSGIEIDGLGPMPPKRTFKIKVKVTKIAKGLPTIPEFKSNKQLPQNALL